MKTRFAGCSLAPVLAVLAHGLMSGAAPATVSTISSNFNGTSIPAGDTIWFSAAFNANGVGSNPATLYVSNAAITFTQGGTNYQIAVPDSVIRFSPSQTTASASFAGNSWDVRVSPNSAGNDFLAGAQFTSPGLSGGINPVSWTADFSTDTPGLTLQWKWGAAVYTSFSSDYNALGVKPIDANTGSTYLNSDSAGTPELFKTSLISGARGGGGNSYTGGYTGTTAVTPLVVVPAPWGSAVLAGMGLFLVRRRR